MKREQLIFSICRVIRAVEQTTGLSGLDHSSRSILTFIGEAETEDKILNVSDVVRRAGFGTPPTVYTRLRELEKAGWIEYAPDPRDGRARQVFLTRLARRAYAKMSLEALKLLEAQ